MPNTLDVALVVLFAVLWPLVEHFWMWPRHVRSVASGVPDARSRLYSRTLVEQWVLAGAVLALTFGFRRSLATLGLSALHGWRLWLALLLPTAYVALVVPQGRALKANPAALARLRGTIAPLSPVIPHTPAEFRRFVPLCFTAGICEELLFRGYLVWVLQAWIGLAAAAGLSMVIFGLAHAYQGVKFGVRAFLAGVAMGLLALLTRSILPGMALHALVDLGSGWICYTAMRGGAESPEQASAGAA